MSCDLLDHICAHYAVDLTPEEQQRAKDLILGDRGAAQVGAGCAPVATRFVLDSRPGWAQRGGELPATQTWARPFCAPAAPQADWAGREWQFDIVANKRNGAGGGGDAGGCREKPMAASRRRRAGLRMRRPLNLPNLASCWQAAAFTASAPPDLLCVRQC